MRKLIVTNIMSLDGYVEGPGGNVMALNMDAAFDAYNLERLRAADLLLYGRTTYLGMSSFWPAVAADPDASDQHRETGQRSSDLPKLVVSDSLTPAGLGPWSSSTTVVGRSEAVDAVTTAKAGGDGDILTFGSHITWNALLRAGAVDELHLMVAPHALGDGTPAFTGEAGLMTLVDVRRFEGSPNVLLQYLPATR